MTPQAPELLPCADIDRMKRATQAVYLACEASVADDISAMLRTAIIEIERLRTRPTPVERPVPQVREALEATLEALTTKCSPSTVLGAINLAREALTARPSDAAVAWPSRDAIAKIIEDNIYRKPNDNWDGDFQDLLVAADEIRALPPDEPARVVGEAWARIRNEDPPLKWLLQELRRLGREGEAAEPLIEAGDHICSLAADLIEQARVTPTVGGEAGTMASEQTASSISARAPNK